MSRPGRTPGVERRSSDVVRRPPDVFDARTHRIARVAVPVGLGLVYGYWVAANSRAGGGITGWNLLLGFASAVVFAVVCAALLMLAPRMPRELHALLWAAFTGCAFGFLYSQSGSFMSTQGAGQGPHDDVVRSVLMSLAVSAVTFAVFFYRYYTRVDASGRRVRCGGTAPGRAWTPAAWPGPTRSPVPVRPDPPVVHIGHFLPPSTRKHPFGGTLHRRAGTRFGRRGAPAARTQSPRSRPGPGGPCLEACPHASGVPCRPY
jgi:hypothetical protein